MPEPINPQPTKGIRHQLIVNKGLLHKELNGTFRSLSTRSCNRIPPQRPCFHVELGWIAPHPDCQRGCKPRIELTVHAEMPPGRGRAAYRQATAFIHLGDGLREWSTPWTNALPRLRRHLLQVAPFLAACAQLAAGGDCGHGAS